MGKVSSHEDLIVYKESMSLVIELYKQTSVFPRSEQFGLVSQMRRAAVSVPSNIAEGAARNSSKEFIRFLYISLGSVTELDTQIEISKSLGYLQDTEGIKQKIFHIKRMLLKLIAVIKDKASRIKQDISE